jgi:nucleotide-binding universal stress UspA family protein
MRVERLTGYWRSSPLRERSSGLHAAGRRAPSAQIELESQRYDVVPLGKESHFEFETQSQPDDTLIQVLRHGYRPVVSVPLTLPQTGHVVVAYDGSAQAACTLQAFEASGLANQQHVHVVSVADSRLEAARTADRAVQFLSLHDIDAHAIPLESKGQPADAILDQSERLNADLLVMGAHGRPSIREFFVGTVTRLVLSPRDRASVPLPLTLQKWALDRNRNRTLPSIVE